MGISFWKGIKMEKLPDYLNEKLSNEEFEEKYKDILDREKDNKPVTEWNSLPTEQPCAVEYYLKGLSEKDISKPIKPIMISCPCKKCSPFC